MCSAFTLDNTHEKTQQPTVPPKCGGRYSGLMKFCTSDLEANLSLLMASGPSHDFTIFHAAVAQELTEKGVTSAFFFAALEGKNIKKMGSFSPFIIHGISTMIILAETTQKRQTSRHGESADGTFTFSKGSFDLHKNFG